MQSADGYEQSTGLSRGQQKLSARFRQLAAACERLVSLRAEVSAWIIGVVCAIPLIFLTPPLQAPDEAQHLERAYQISEGHLWSRVENGRSGDVLPVSLSQFVRRFLGTTDTFADRSPSPKPLRVTFGELQQPLNPEQRAFTDFSGSSFYSPLAYVPQVVGVLAGRLLQLSPLGLLYLSRLANAAAALLVLAFAIRSAPAYCRAALMFVGLMPMSVSLYASVSPDATIIVSALLFAAACASAQMLGTWTEREILIAAVSGAVFCSVKPVYAPLLLAGLVPAVFRRKTRRTALIVHLLIVVVALGCSYLWMQSVKSLITLTGPYHPNPSKQLSFIVHHPVQYVSAIGATLTGERKLLFRGFIGLFGWETVKLPKAFYATPLLAFALALFISQGQCHRRQVVSAFWQMALTMVTGLLIITALYMAWSRVGARFIEGIQGRYFLPVAGIAVIAVCSLMRTHRNEQIGIAALLFLCILAIQLASANWAIAATFEVFS